MSESDKGNGPKDGAEREEAPAADSSAEGEAAETPEAGAADSSASGDVSEAEAASSGGGDGEPPDATETTIRLDPRYVLPIGALAIVVLVIVVIQLCGSNGDTPEPAEVVDQQLETAELGPTFTPGPSPTPGAETPTPEAGPTVPEGAAGTPEERDAQRQQDLLAIQEALEAYDFDNGEYPNSGGGVQSLCVFTDFDVGCELQEYIDPIPADPLGEPARYGYFYASDGQTYSVYAIRESDTIPECPDHPEHIQETETVLCVQGS